MATDCLPHCMQVLKRNEGALQRIFACIVSSTSAVGNESASHAAERQKHTSRERSYAPERAIPTVALRPWLHALKRLHVIGADLSERDAVRCFSWARMADCH